MKKIFILSVIICLVVYGCTNLLKLTSQKNTSTIEPNAKVSSGDNKEIILNITENEKHRINNNILGVNTGFTFREEIDKEKDFLYFYNQLNPKVVRFPGGTVANYYHPNQSGYGFSKKVMLSNKTFSPLSKLQLDNKPDILNQFIALCKENNASAIYVANVHEGTPEEMIYVLQQLKNNNIKILGVELGNEFILLMYRNEYPNPETYINKAKPFANVLRKFFPDIPIGVVTDGPLSAQELKTQRGKFFHAWNLALAKANFFDACILHTYNKCKSCLENNNFDLIFESSNNSEINLLNTYFSDMTNYYETVFGKDKKIWITECNLGQWKLFENTQFQANYEMKFFIRLLKENINNNSLIDIVNWHFLGTNGLIFTTKGKIAAKEVKGNYMTSSEYFPFYYLSKAVDNSASIVESNFSNNDLADFLVIENNNGKKSLLFVNSNAYDLQLNINSNWQAKSMDYLYSDYLYGAGGNTYFAKNYPDKNLSINYGTKDINSKNIIIPKYSTGLITLE